MQNGRACRVALYVHNIVQSVSMLCCIFRWKRSLSCTSKHMHANVWHVGVHMAAGIDGNLCLLRFYIG